MTSSETIMPPITQGFAADGWTVVAGESGSALAYETETLSVRLTDLSGKDVPSSDADWMITSTSKIDGTIRQQAAPADQPWLTVHDAISFLPSYNLVCTHCGSDDVVCDAAARWNPEEGQWEISSTFDDRNCDSCGAEGSNILKAVMHGPNLLTDDEAG